MDQPEQILEVWFADVVARPESLAARFDYWFGSEEDTVDSIRARDEWLAHRFLHDVELASTGKLDGWTLQPRGRLALILLIDQFRRNIFRGTAQAFSHDRQALELAMTGLRLGDDEKLAHAERLFFYMPFQHSESSAVQEQSVKLFERLVTEATPVVKPVFENVLRYARMHRDIIQQFGRFPLRNRMLGRANTPAELAFVSKSANDFS
ncbi:MAG TPA: DUF924 family protein [Steroidobacteraceae bacterium]|nr:DUF924 family protein [Steroidobacteraceae bacterium]